MKNTLLFLAFAMLGRMGFAQDFNLVDSDSLNLHYPEGFIEIHMEDYKHRYDSSYLKMSSRILELLPQIIEKNEDVMPHEIRYIYNEHSGEYIKIYNEAEEESNSWELQKALMWNIRAMRPRGPWRVYIADQEKGFTFIILAQDSLNLIKLLNKNICENYTKYGAEIKRFSKPKNGDPYFIQITDTSSTGQAGYYIHSQKINKYVGKVAIGLATNTESSFIALNWELSRLIYSKYTPKYKLGICSHLFVGPNRNSSDSTKMSGLNLFELKLSYLQNDKPWLGVKIGIGSADYGNMLIHSVKTIAYGMSFENTRFADFDLDLIIPIKNKYGFQPAFGPRAMLSLKLPF